MLSDEEKEIFNNLKDYMQNNIDNGYHKFIYNDLDWDFKCIDCINVIDNALKQSKEIEELKKEKETNQQMIHLAETQILGYGQGYKDGLNKETTATEIVARERENQIIYEGMKHKINMEWVLKIKAKIEEVKDGTFDAKIVLQSLLEKE